MPSAWNIDIAGQPGVGPPGISGAGYLATSTTNLSIATGPVTVTTQTGLAYQPGARVRLSSNSAPTQWMEGLCTAYSGSTGSLSITIDLTSAMAATAVTAVYPPNYLGGLTLSNDATSPNTVLDIATGGATSDDNQVMLALSTAFTKNCNAAFVAGSGNGALDAGSVLAASTWYHVYLIMRTDTNVVDVLISTSATNPTFPANYTKKRRIGSIKTNASSQICAFTQLGDGFLWGVGAVASGWDIATNAAVAQAPGTLFTLNTPLGVKTDAIVNAAQTGGTAQLRFMGMDEDPAMAGSGQNMPTAANGQVNNRYILRTNTSQQIRVAGHIALASGLYLGCAGWYDYRGK